MKTNFIGFWGFYLKLYKYDSQEYHPIQLILILENVQ